MKSFEDLREKKLTPAELKKREEIAKAMERENPGMDMGKKMAIATATAKKVAEEIELDEVSDKKLDAYRQKAFADQPAGDDGSAKYRKRKFGRDLAFDKQTGRAKVLATKEETELNEALAKTEIPKSRYETILKAHGPKKLEKTPNGKMQYKGSEHVSSDKSTNTHVSQTYSHPDHNIATIEKHTHRPTGKVTYYMYKKSVKEETELGEARDVISIGSADKKPENFRDKDGKLKTRMVPVKNTKIQYEAMSTKKKTLKDMRKAKK